MDISLIITALLSGLFAGLISIGVTLAIEKFGGLIGGIMGTTPTVVISASIGLAVRLDIEHMKSSLSGIPVGILINAGFLTVWKFGPKLLPESINNNEKKRVTALTIASLLYWLIFAIITVISLQAINNSGVIPPYGVALVGIGLTVILGFFVAWMFPVPAPKGKKKITKRVIFYRGCLSATAITSAILLSAVNGIVGGVVSMFPAVFLTTCVSLSLSQGSAVSSGALGPMMLGSTSVGTFALIFGYCVELFVNNTNLDFALNLFLSFLIAYVASVGGVSIPVAFLLRWRAKSVLSGRTFKELEEIEVEVPNHEHEHEHEQEHKHGHGHEHEHEEEYTKVTGHLKLEDIAENKKEEEEEEEEDVEEVQESVETTTSTILSNDDKYMLVNQSNSISL